MTLTNWAAIAAKGTSHAVSISPSPSVHLPNSTNSVETSRKSKGNNENESTCTVPSSSSSTSSNEELCSPSTSTSKDAGSTVQVSTTKPIPAPAPIKNPWRVQEIIRQLEEKKDDHIAPDLLTPAESKDIKTVVREPILSTTMTETTLVGTSSSSTLTLNAAPATKNGKNGAMKKSKGTIGIMNGDSGQQKSKYTYDDGFVSYIATSHGLYLTRPIRLHSNVTDASLKKTLQHNGTILNSKSVLKETKDSSRKNTSLDKTQVKKNVSSDSQEMGTKDKSTNSDTKDETGTQHANHSNASTKKKATVTSSTSDNTTSSSNVPSTSPKKKVPKQGANHTKSNISSNKTKANNKPKKNVNKKKNKSNRNNGGQMNNNAYYYVPTPEEMEALKLAAVVQIEYFFSIDELVKNIYLRKQMDSEGYIPAAVVFNFPSVLSYCIPYYDLLAAVDTHAQTIEVDFDNECLRLKGGEAVYKKWLMPNPDGTLGCAKWIKEVPQSVKENVVVPLDTAENVSKGLINLSVPMEEEKKEDDESTSLVLANEGDHQ